MTVVSEVGMRMLEIRSQLAALAPPAPAAAGGGTAAVAATGTRFASVLDSAMAAMQPSASPWASPVQGGSISSHFGPRWGTHHDGLDIAAASGTPVRAVGAGTVVSAGWQDGYGNTVVLDHGDGVTTLYAHNSELVVTPGQRVSAGELISKVGSTGDSTGPHLHLEVKVGDRKVDPLPWLRERNVSL
jgi:murein DD-endopeptidase MepM/ murein hydrolase activator NlpD